MNTTTSRAITVATACAMFGGQCGCAHMSDQLKDYPVDTVNPQIAAVGLAIAATLASVAPAVNSIVDDRRLNEATGMKWYQRKTMRDYLRVALTCKNADIRRIAVLKIMGSGDVSGDSVFEGLETVARRDSSPAVRWVAIRGLSGVHDPRPVRVAVRILNHEGATDNVRSTDVQVRWECLLLLDDFCERGLVRKAQHEAVRDVMIRHLGQSYHHDVRITAAKGLRHFEDEVSRTALTHALEDDDVGVALRAKQSLQTPAETEHIAKERRKRAVSNTPRADSPGWGRHHGVGSEVLSQVC